MEVEDNTILINVFFCGTAGSIEYETTQIGLFANDCLSTDLMYGDYSPVANNYKMYFDGCGVTNGIASVSSFSSYSQGQWALFSRLALMCSVNWL